MASDLAVVILNYNTRDDLRNCLASLRLAQGGLSFEMVVVDNCSTDGSAAMVRAEHPWVQHLIEAERNGGYAYGNNLGFRALGLGAEAPLPDLPRYTLLLNPDTIVPPTAPALMVAFMDAHPDIGVAGPKLVRADGSLDRACRRSFPSVAVSFYYLVGLARMFPHSPRLARYNLTYLDENQEAEVDAVVGACMLMRTAALEQVGGLDEAFFMYGEDLDLCYRIKERGWRVVYHPAVTVLHLKGQASRKASRRAIVAFYQSMRIFHNKHYRQRTFFLVNWAIDAAIWLLCQWALLSDRLRSPERRRVASA